MNSSDLGAFKWFSFLTIDVLHVSLIYEPADGADNFREVQAERYRSGMDETHDEEY